MSAAPQFAFGSDLVELPSGLVVPEDCIEQRPKAVDLFCGCGGFSLGMISAGFEVVAACDFDTTCAMTYMHNLGTFPCQFWWVEPEDEKRMEKALQKSMFGHKSRAGEIIEPCIAGGGWLKSEKHGTPGVKNFFLGDICKLKGEDILRAIGLERGELDCVCGSPPCQGFSTAGKRKVLDFRNSLVFQFARLVIELLPKTMVFENVPGILSMVTPDGIPVIDAFARMLEDGGFAGLDALRRTLAAQTGSVGLMRSKATKRAGRMVRQVKAAKSKQGGLF